MGASAALYNPHGRFRPDAGNAQKVGILSRVDLHRKQLHMAQRPVAFRVELCMKVRVGFIEQFIRLKTVEAEQPVCLIEPMLPQQRRLGIQRGQAGVLGHRDVGGVKHPFQVILIV